MTMLTKSATAVVATLLLCFGAAAQQQDCPPFVPPPKRADAPVPSAPPAPVVDFEVRGGGSQGSPLLFIGDSLTRGTGTSDLQFSYPSVVSELLGQRAYVVYARGGQAAPQLAKFLVDAERPDGTYVIWAGNAGRVRANATVKAIQSMVASLPTDRYLVLSVLPGNLSGQPEEESLREANVELNALLEAAFSGNYLRVGLDLECSDTRDRIHLRDAGYAKIATTVANELMARGW